MITLDNDFKDILNFKQSLQKSLISFGILPKPMDFPIDWAIKILTNKMQDLETKIFNSEIYWKWKLNSNTKIFRYSSKSETLTIFQNGFCVDYWLEYSTFIFRWKVNDLKESPVHWFIEMVNQKFDFVTDQLIYDHMQTNTDTFIIKSQLIEALINLKNLIIGDFEIYEHQDL